MKRKHRGKRAFQQKYKKKGASSSAFHQHPRFITNPGIVNIRSGENKRTGDNCIPVVNNTTISGFNNNLIADTTQKHKKKKKKKKKSAAFLKEMFGEKGISDNNESRKLPQPDINLLRPTSKKDEPQSHSTHAHGLDSNYKPVDTKSFEKKEPEKNPLERVFFGPNLPPSTPKDISTMPPIRRNGSLEKVVKDSAKVAGGMPVAKSLSMENCSNENAWPKVAYLKKSLASASASFFGAAAKKPSVNGTFSLYDSQLDVNRIKKPVNPQYNALAINRSVSMAGTAPRPSPLINYGGWKYKEQENLNNSCYMNTTMQVLAACPIFVSLLDLAVNSLSQRSKIIECFNDLLRWLTGNGESRGPVRRGHLMKMQGCIRHLDRVFEEWGGAAQQDAEELLTTLLDAVSDECTGKGLRHANGRRSFGFHPQPIRIAPACCDPVKILEVITKNVKRCGNCDHASEVEAKEHRVHLGVGEMERNGTVPGTIKCVQQLIAAEISEVERVEDYTCEKCRTKGATSGTKQYVRFGEYIIIVLKRFAHDRYGNVRKLSTPIRTPLYIEMGDYIHGKTREKKESSETQKKKSEDDREEMERTKKDEMTNRIEESEEERRERRRLAKKRRKMEKIRQMEEEKKHLSPVVNEMGKSETDEPPRKKMLVGEIYGPKEESPVKDAHRRSNESENVFPVSKSTMEQTGGGILGVKRRASDWDYESDKTKRIRRKLEERGLKRIKTAEGNEERQLELSEEERRRRNTIINNRTRNRWRTLFADTDPLPPPGYIMFRPVDGIWMRSQCALLGLKYKLDNSFPPPILQKLRAQSNLCEVRQTPGETVRIGEDGNCMFRALAWWVTGSEEQHGKIRRCIVNFMMRFPKRFGAELTGPEGQLYTRESNGQMFSDGEWGTQCEIYGAATLLGVDIYTYHENRWKRYGPLFEWRSVDGRRKKLTRKRAPLERTRYGIYLANSSNLHYDVVKYMEPTAPKTNTSYRLLGAILHHGRTIESGHYTANIYDQESKKWLHCDDDHIVTRSTIKVLEEAMNNGYVLVYGKTASMMEKEESGC